MSKKSRLLLREWILLSLTLGFFLFLIVVSQRQGKLGKDLPLAEKGEVILTIRGAVEEEVEIRCRPGVSVRAALKGVRLPKTADKQQIPYKKILYVSQDLEIPTKKSLWEKTEVCYP